MKKCIVSLFLFVFFLVLQTSPALAGGFVRGRFPSKGFVLGPGHHEFVSPSVVIINPSHRSFVRVSPFNHQVIVLPHRFAGNTVIIQEPFFCFDHGIGFINEASFFDHLHRFHGLAFETIPNVIVHSGPQVFFFGN